MRYPSCYVLVTDLDDSTAELYSKNHNPYQAAPQQQQPHPQQQCMQLKFIIYLSIFL